MLPRSTEQRQGHFLCPKRLLLIPEDIPGGHVGKFTLILSHTMLSTERMPTSQAGFSTCLVPTREEILGDNVEKQLCRVVNDKNKY